MATSVDFLTDLTLVTARIGDCSHGRFCSELRPANARGLSGQRNSTQYHLQPNPVRFRFDSNLIEHEPHFVVAESLAE